jgi:hypothetical protein
MRLHYSLPLGLAWSRDWGDRLRLRALTLILWTLVLSSLTLRLRRTGRSLRALQLLLGRRLGRSLRMRRRMMGSAMLHSDLHLPRRTLWSGLLRSLGRRMRLHLNGRRRLLMRWRRMHEHLLVVDRHSLRNIIQTNKFVPEEVCCGTLAYDSASEDAVILGWTRNTMTWVGRIDVASPTSQMTATAASFAGKFSNFGRTGDCFVLIRLEWRMVHHLTVAMLVLRMIGTRSRLTVAIRAGGLNLAICAVRLPRSTIRRSISLWLTRQNLL